MSSIKKDRAPSVRTAARRAVPRLEQLEVREVLSGYPPTGVEQEFLERLNDARANPAAYGRSIGLDLSGVAASQPLAFNAALVQSSRDHSADMSAHNYFGHSGSDGSSPFQRMSAAGFPWHGAAESIAAGYATPAAALAALIIDAGVADLGHRKQLLSFGGPPDTLERQTGVGVVLNGTGSYRHYYTIDSGYTADTRPVLTGVAYNDLNKDGRYENGEGLGGVTVIATGPGGTYVTTTWGSGGYSLPVAPGVYTVTAAGGGMRAGVSRAVAVGSANSRLNFTPPPAVSATTTSVAATLNPSVAGQAVTFTATVRNAAGSGGAPIGRIAFLDGATYLGAGSALSGSGAIATSTFTTAALSAGAHTLKAVFTPTGAFAASQGTLTQTVAALPFSDGFTQSDGSPLSRSWTVRFGSFSVRGGQARANGAGLNIATVNHAGAKDVVVQAGITLSSTGRQFAGLVARYSGPVDGNMYLGQVVGSNGVFTASIYRNVGGNWARLSSTALPGGTGLLVFTVQGTHLQLLFNGQVVGDVTDGALSGPGLPGLRNRPGALVDDFSVQAL